MKKALLVIICVFVVINMYARVHYGLSYMLLTAPQKSPLQSKDLLNYAKRSALGWSFNVSKQVYENFYLGASLNLTMGSLKKDAIATALENGYSGEYYNSVMSSGETGNQDSWGIVQMGLTFSYVIHTSFAEVEPVLLLGVGEISNEAEYIVNRKKMNDNYSEKITLQTLGGTAFYPGLGVLFNKHIGRKWYFNLGLMYNAGKSSYVVTERKTDFLDNVYPENQYTYNRSMSTLQVMAGFQLRFKQDKNIKIENQSGKH